MDFVSGQRRLETVASALNYAAAVSEMPADRIGRRNTAIEDQGGIEEQGDIRRARLAFERKNVRGPRRQGPHAATQANSDLQVLRKASTSLDSLRTAASELKNEAAASDPIVDRNERSWKKTTNR